MKRSEINGMAVCISIKNAKEARMKVQVGQIVIDPATASDAYESIVSACMSEGTAEFKLVK